MDSAAAGAAIARPSRLAASLLPGLLLVVSLLAACATPGDPVVSAPAGQVPAFQGLTGLAGEAAPSPIDILVVRKRCRQGEDWAEDALGQVSQMLGAATVAPIHPLPVHQAETGPPAPMARAFGASVDNDRWQARLAAIAWSPASRACDGDAASAPPPATDPAADLEPAAAALPMQAALVAAARHFEAGRDRSTAPERPLVIVAQGQGGLLALTTLAGLPDDDSRRSIGEHLVSRTAGVFLTGSASLPDSAAPGSDDPGDPAAAFRLAQLRLTASMPPSPPSPPATSTTPTTPSSTTSPTAVRIIRFRDPHGPASTPARSQSQSQAAPGVTEVSLELEGTGRDALRDPRVRALILCGYPVTDC